MTQPEPRYNEIELSQIPALQLLTNMGYTCIPATQTLTLRHRERGSVVLESILEQQLRKINSITHKGKSIPFSDDNIKEAVYKLKNMPLQGLVPTNEKIYNLITLGTAMVQTIKDTDKGAETRLSFTLKYIDWDNLENNTFHVVPEFVVERNLSNKTIRPDIVLFVNGIPLVVIECKAPGIDVEQAVSQNIRNQKDDYAPKLFTYVQLIMGINKNFAKYGTTGTPSKFWGVWNEREDKQESVAKLINKPLTDNQKDALFCDELADYRNHFDQKETSETDMTVTEQDKALYSLCRPERLLDIVRNFTLFDGGDKKIARYQQFFVVRSTLKRIEQLNQDGSRAGGIVWHTQGSGKSLTMVMLARAIALSKDIPAPRVILVTDRNDLDRQLGNTFYSCDMDIARATTGRNLVKHLKNKTSLITTIIHKFDKGWEATGFTDTSTDIFVLVDESHRTNFGDLANRMRQMLPNACYIGFSGTPLLKKEKNSFTKFGSLIKPHYSISQAVTDKAVLPLLYEGRHVEMTVNKDAIDIWFERHTVGLTEKQQRDLKKKYARAKVLNGAEQVVFMRAFDISEHYHTNWKGTGFKAQLVAPDKATAIEYHKALNELGVVSSEIIISSPDTRENNKGIDESTDSEVVGFWNRMMTKYGSEERYTKQIISNFKDSDNPEILIVVDKLLTGFDAPRNTVLYLCRRLIEHTLLQAIARVNRLHEGKEYGYIVDYASVLGKLDEALTMYDALAGFDEDDLKGTLVSVRDEVEKLPQAYSHLWDVFKEVKSQGDDEAFEKHLADDKLRDEFYARLTEYSKTLSIALSTEVIYAVVGDEMVKTYKNDLKRFYALRKSVMLRYADGVDYSVHDPKIRKLIDTHIQADSVTQTVAPFNILDDKAAKDIDTNKGVFADKSISIAAKADIIAYTTKRAINERMDEDPAFYKKFSELIQQAIDDFKEQRVSAQDYLGRAMDIRNQVASHKHDDVPESIASSTEACAYYGIVCPLLSTSIDDSELLEKIAAQTALEFQSCLKRYNKVDFWADKSALNNAERDMDDFFYDKLKGEQGIAITTEQMDKIIKKVMHTAQARDKAS